MSDSDDSFLGGLENAGAGLLHTAEDLGSAAEDLGASMYHAGAGALDVLTNDRPGAEQQMDQMQAADQRWNAEVDQAEKDFGI